MARPVNVLVDLTTGNRPAAFAVTFRQGEKETSWLLTAEEAGNLAVQLTGALVGQAVAQA